MIFELLKVLYLLKVKVIQNPESFTDDFPVAYMLNSYLPPELCFILFIRVIRLELGDICVEAK